MNRSNNTYTSKFIDDTQDDDMDMFSLYYSELFNEALEPNSLYVFTMYPINSKLLILYAYIIFCVLIH